MSGRDGVLGMPVRLAVCFVVIGVMVPVVMDAAWDAEEESSGFVLEAQANRVRSAAVKAFYGDGYASAEVDLPPGGSLMIGGDGADAYAVRLLSYGEEIGKVYLENPDIRVIGPETVLSGFSTITFRSVTDGSGYGVEVVR